jgi:ADP-heptose:LPS heptosyltransferase
LKSKIRQTAEITVCGRHFDIFRNHACVNRAIDVVPESNECFDMHFRLCEDIFEQDISKNQVDICAEKLGVSLVDRHPCIEVDSYDLVRTLRFNISNLKHPRIVIAPGASDAVKMWDEDKWIELCAILEDKVHASIIQLGDAGERFLGFGKDLIGKVTARESAAIISRCDLLVSVENGYEHLAEAVKTPCVVLFDRDRTGWEYSDSSLAIVADEGTYSEGSVGCMEDISLASVINGIVDLCGNEQ